MNPRKTSGECSGAAPDATLAPDAPRNNPERKVTIVILTWNGLEYTKKCLDTLRANTAHSNYKIVVADNGSTDGTLEFVRSLPWVTVLSNASNLGFARGNNCAIREADSDSDILLLNNDTEVYQPDWLEKMQAAAHLSPDIGVVGCRLARPDGTLQHAGTFMPVETFWGQQIGGGERDVNQFNADRDVEGVVFACVYLKREVLTTVGLLCEDYFSYFEDTDYCLRVREAGYRVLCCGSVTIIHHENISTSINNIKHGDVFLKAQRIFRQKWEDKFKSDRYNRRIAWQSIFNFPTGYAISSREIASALDRACVNVSYKYVYGPGTVFPKPEPEQSDNYLINIIRGRRLDGGAIQVVYGQGDVFAANSGKYRIGFTMLETDRIPAEWVRQANLMHEVWVPSTFNAETFRDSGVLPPVHVIPLGVDPDHFNPGIARHPLVGAYVFLSIFEWGERKAPEILLRAFNDEFRAAEPVILLCKTSNVDPGADVQSQISALNLDPNGGKIHVAQNCLIPTYQLGCVYSSADCFVLPTRGEGWGMPVIEAMACGVPVIATDWSAHRDFMNEENSYPLPIEGLVRAEAKCPYYTGFKWAEPSYRHLRRLLRHVYENQEEARQKGAKASLEVRTKWTWDCAARKIIDRLDAIHSSRGER